MPDLNPNLIVEGLADPRIYDHPCEEIRVMETHISWVILTGPFAYKIKKPVQLDFVDCSTLERRKFFCEEELRLNRRLAPDLYLEVIPIYGKPAEPSLPKDGEPIEYAVKMVQFDQEKLLSHIIGEGKLTSGHIDDLVEQVSDFHRKIEKADAESSFASPELIDRQARENFPPLLQTITLPKRKDQILELRQWFEREFTELRGEFNSRKQNGCIRECHGDMHLGNMVLVRDRVVIFDGIDFNAQLRWIDVAAEVAFLTMDLEDRGAAGLSHRFINGYLEATGDHGMLKVLPFYMAYRALVRAKVAAIRLGQSDLPDEERSGLSEEILSYLDLAQRYIRPHRPGLTITHGFSGSGKTWGTQRLLEEKGAIRIRSDVERKRLFGLGPLAHSDERPGLNIYTHEATERTYARLEELARLILKAGYPVIVDATFLKKGERDTFRLLAEKWEVPFTILDFQADEATLRRRIQERQKRNADASEADLSVLDKQLRSGEPLTEAERPFTRVVDAGKIP